MSEHPLDHDYISSHSFTPRIRELWEERKRETILTQALGPDPVLFAWEVIQEWESRNSPNFDGLE